MADYPLVLPVLTDEVGTALQPLNAPDMPSWAAHISREVEAIAAELGLSPSAAFSTVTARFADIDSQLGALPGAYVTVVGSSASPITDPNQARPAGAVAVLWIMDTGVTPVNATDADLTITIDEVLGIADVDGLQAALDLKASITYVDSIVAAQDAMVFKGVIDASANPNYPAADRGHTYRISVAGKIGGASGTNVEVGDLIVCLTDGTAAGTQAAVGANWSIVQTNLDGAVIGPATATDGAIVLFDGATGKLVKNSTAATAKAFLALVKGDVGLGNVDNTSDANKPVSTAQQAALDLKAGLHVTETSQTNDYTLVLADDGTVIAMNKATAVTVTVPPASSVAFPTGTVLEIYQLGAGQVTIAAGAGVTLRTPNGAKTAKQYSSVGLRYRGGDIWVVSGDTTT